MTATEGRFAPADEDLNLPEPLGECPEVSVPMDPMTRRRNAISELRAEHIECTDPWSHAYRMCIECERIYPCAPIRTLDKWGV